ncbi:MAG: pyridoxamine 5'-phosphate oxidase family protein [Dehalococcoidia bacterium]
MSREIGHALPANALIWLQGGHSVVVTTVDEASRPWTGVMSWVRAVDPRTIHLIIANFSESLRNLRANGQIMLQLLGDDFTYGVRGIARVVEERLEGAPVPAVLVEMTVEYVKDDLTPGRLFRAQIDSWWPDEAKQAVEDRGLSTLRAYDAARA